MGIKPITLGSHNMNEKHVGNSWRWYWESVGIKAVMLEFEECGNHTHDVGIGGLWKTIIARFQAMMMGLEE